MTKLVVVVAALTVLTGCQAHQPLAPNAAVSLSLNQTTFELSRNATGTLTLVAQRGAIQTDVTAEAAWESLNPAVVSVAAGRVTSVGIGVGVIKASYGGTSATATVTSRRNTRVVGAVTLTDVASGRLLSFSTALLDGAPVGYFGGSDHSGYPQIMVSFGTRGEKTDVVPGAHELGVKVTFWGRGPDSPTAVNVTTNPDAPLQVIDVDTGELVDTLKLPARVASLRYGDTILWPIQIRSYAN